MALRFFLALVMGAAVSFFITPVVKKAAVAAGAVDHPIEERKVHREPIPRWGGIAIYISFFTALGGQFVLQYFFGAQKLVTGSEWFLGIFMGGTIILILGLVDDIANLHPLIKFLGQILATLCLIYFGIRIEFIGIPFLGVVSFSGWGVLIGIALTILWVVGLANTVNFIDGLDGLAAGVCAVALVALAFTAFQTGRIDAAIVCLALAGSNLGFLRHNFNPARIFMGDSGSMFLGFMLGAITIQGMMKSIAAIALLVPIVIMGIPIFDAVFTVFRRVKNGQAIMQADDGHIHHRLLYQGFSHRQTVIIIYLWSIVLSVAAITFISSVDTEYQLIIFCTLAVFSFFLARYSGLFKWLKELRRRGFAVGARMRDR